MIRYTFREPALLSQALTHASVSTTGAASNERLEFLGDAVLGLVVCHELHDRYGDLLEGGMTKVKSVVVSRQVCAEVAEGTGMAALVWFGGGAGTGRLPPSVSAAVFEAIIGAIYLDGGLAAARDFILTHLQPYIAQTLDNEHQFNYKSVLQQYTQRRWCTTPEYRLLDEKGPDHSKCFEIGVAVGGRQFPSAWGKSKKDAEQEAARRALIHLGMLDGPEGTLEGQEPPSFDES